MHIVIQRFRIRDFRFEIKKRYARKKTSKKIYDFAFKLFCFFANILLILIYLIYKVYSLHSIRRQKFEIRALYKRNKFTRHLKWLSSHWYLQHMNLMNYLLMNRNICMREMISNCFRIIAYFNRLTKYRFELTFVHKNVVIIKFQMNFEHRKEFFNQDAQWCIESFALSMHHDFELKWCVRCDSFLASYQMIRCNAKHRDYDLYDDANNLYISI